VASVVLKVIFGTLIAVLLNRLGRWGGNSHRAGAASLDRSRYRAGHHWKSVLDPDLRRGEPPALDLNIIDKPLLFLSGIKSALPTLVMINLWQGIPFFVINIPGRTEGN